jgi:hypothetical protein
LVTFTAFYVEDLVRLTRIAFLITEIKNAALGAVEAYLLLIFNKRSAQGAICQVVTGRPLKNIDFIVTGRCRPRVPIFCIQVWLKIATKSERFADSICQLFDGFSKYEFQNGYGNMYSVILKGGNKKTIDILRKIYRHKNDLYLQRKFDKITRTNF